LQETNDVVSYVGGNTPKGMMKCCKAIP
jgi:hypothetical protein